MYFSKIVIGHYCCSFLHWLYLGKSEMEVPITFGHVLYINDVHN